MSQTCPVQRECQQEGLKRVTQVSNEERTLSLSLDQVREFRLPKSQQRDPKIILMRLVDEGTSRSTKLRQMC